MLPVRVKLNRHVISMTQGVLHARLHATGKPKICGMAHVVKAVLLTELQRAIARAIVDDHVVNVRSHGRELVYRREE